MSGGGARSPLSNSPPPPPLWQGLFGQAAKKGPFSLEHPLSKGGLCGIAHRVPFSAILDQKTLKHRWWTKI